MKVIFLDIDGVLNSEETFKQIALEYQKTNKARIEIEEEKIEYLREIAEQTDAKIVLSSSWRIFFKSINNEIIPLTNRAKALTKLLAKHNVFIYDITPKNASRKREDEINDYLKSHNVENFIIIDDEIEHLESFYGNNMIKTNFFSSTEESGGLCKKHIKLAIEMLNNKDKKTSYQRIRK